MKPRLQSRLTRIVSGFVIAAAIFGFASFAESRDTADRTGKFFGGASLGLQTDTADGTAFALGLYGDYYLTHGFSIGPLLQAGFTDNLFQLGLSAQAKYTFTIPDIPRLKPHVQAGLGFIHADLDGRNGNSGNDTSFLIPLGIGAEYRLTQSVSLDSAVLVNFNDLDYRDGDAFMTWFAGVKIQF